MSVLLDVIRGRKSFRSFDGSGIAAQDRKKLEEYAAEIEKEQGQKPVVSIADPGISIAEDMEYIASV